MSRLASQGKDEVSDLAGRVSDHRIGELDFSTLVKPVADKARSKPFIIRQKKVVSSSEVQEEDLRYYFTVQANLGKLKKRYKARHAEGYRKVQVALDVYRMIFTNPKQGIKYSEQKSEALTFLNQAIKDAGDSGSLDMLVSAAMKTSFGIEGEKIMRDEMQSVVPGLYIGGWKPANNKPMLKSAKVTHIVCCIDVSEPERYPQDFEYHCIKADDRDDEDLFQYFQEAVTFIRQALCSGGIVYVHCGAGISRSATICSAFLISELHMTSKQAVNCCIQARPFVRPNNGFLKQLKRLEEKEREMNMTKTVEEGSPNEQSFLGV